MKIDVLNRDSSSPVLTATVPCKVNLFLDVLGKRQDGYHELDTVMLGVSLCDTVIFQPSHNQELRLRMSYADPESFGQDDPAWNVPADHRNLAWKALKLLASELNVINFGGELHIHKAIPSMAGLGGGSANAAAALVLGLMAWGTPDDWPVVIECARRLGSDINFFLEGVNQDGYWIARCTGRGEKIEPLPGILDALALVLVHPPVGCSTAQVFSMLTPKEHQTTASPNASNPCIERMSDRLAVCDVSGVGGELYNALRRPAEKVTDWISQAGRWMDRYDHVGRTLSGSGSASFCLCSSSDQAEIIERELRSLKMVRAYYVRPWHQSSLQKQMQAIKGLSQ